jgi:hypothetical protein
MRDYLYRIKRKLNYYWRIAYPHYKVLDQVEDDCRFFQSGINVALTNACNAKCVFCAYKLSHQSRTVIKDDLVEKIVCEYNSIAGGAVNLAAGVGDPLVDPYFWRHLSILKSSPKIKLMNIVTNLIAAKKVGIERLALEGPKYISVSIGGFDAATYKRVFQRDCYSDVIESLLEICHLRKSAGIPIGVSVCCRSDQSRRQITSQKDYKRLLDYLPKSAIVLQSKGFDNWAGKITEEDLLTGMTLKKPKTKKTFPCDQLYANLGIYPDGTSVACACRDLDGTSDLRVGNVATDHLLDIGLRVAKIRAAWRNGNIPSICERCTMYSSVTNCDLKKFNRLLVNRNEQINSTFYGKT